MLAFLLHVAASSNLSKAKDTGTDGKSSGDSAIYFDILGTYMIVFRQRFATMMYNSIIMQSLLIWATSLFMGDSSAIISFWTVMFERDVNVDWSNCFCLISCLHPPNLVFITGAFCFMPIASS